MSTEKRKTAAIIRREPNASSRPSRDLGIGGGEERMLEACEAVIDITAAFFNVSSKDIRRPGRCALCISRVRQVAMYVAHVVLRLNMSEVGKAFGRDRTTVVHACHLIEDLRDDEDFDLIVSRAERIVMAAFGLQAGN